MIKIKKKDFDSLINGIANIRLKEWQDGSAVVNELPLEMEPSIISPKSQTQVSDTDLPIEDEKWSPGNLDELGRAMKQMAQRVPDTKVEWFYARLRNLINKAIDETDEERMAPRLGDEVDDD